MKGRYQHLIAPSIEKRSANIGTPAPRLNAEQAQTLMEIAGRLLDETTKMPPILASERRRTGRQAFPRQIVVTPCDDLDAPALADSEVLVAKDLSARGLSFLHTRRPASTRILITFPSEAKLPTCLLSEIRHVEPIRRGLYQVGVEFLQKVYLVAENDGDASLPKLAP